MNDYTKVTYNAIQNSVQIRKFLKGINDKKVLAFDTECRSIYTPEEREEAKALIKSGECEEYRQLAHMVAESSGLSFPEISKTTHFVLSDSESHSTILVTDNPIVENYIWKKISEYEGLLLIHNALFDLKPMMQRVGKVPANYVDTQLMAKCLTNHVNPWKCKVGLKDIMGQHYEPAWAMMEDYEPKDLMEPKFLQYAAIDGAATFNLYNILLEMFDEY